MSSTIRVEGLEVDLDGTTVLHDISFTLEGGKIYGLLGRNGSGKSVLMSALAGLQRPTRGRVQISGRPVFGNAGVATEVCMAQATPRFPAELGRVHSALRVVAGLRPSWDADYIRTLLAKFGVDEHARLRDLSRSARASLSTCIALASRVPVTLLDEAHLGLDAPSRELFYDEILAEVMAHPRVFVVATYLVEEVGWLFDDVLMLDSGRLVMHESVESLNNRGARVTGPAQVVDRFVQERLVLDEWVLGHTKVAVIYGLLMDEERELAVEAGLDVGPLELNELFMYLTRPSAG